MLRTVLCWMMIAVIPASLLGADTGAAMLYGKGVVLLNGATLPNSSAIYPDDVIETKADSVANINVTGSTVMVMPDSIVKFKNNAISLEHGSVAVSTSSGMRVYVKCVTVIPVSNVPTQFDVTNTNGTVHAAARKSDVNIDTGGKLKDASKRRRTSRVQRFTRARTLPGKRTAVPQRWKRCLSNCDGGTSEFSLCQYMLGERSLEGC